MSVATIKRTCSASVESAFATWIDPVAMRHFWTADPDWLVTDVTIDARLGGSFRVEFTPPGESPLVEEGTYEEFQPPHRIVYLEHVLRENSTLHGPSPTTVTFRKLGDGETEIQVISTLALGEAPEARSRGWGNQLDLFVRYVDGAP